jgi:hypothetical protein
MYDCRTDKQRVVLHTRGQSRLSAYQIQVDLNLGFSQGFSGKKLKKNTNGFASKRFHRAV